MAPKPLRKPVRLPSASSGPSLSSVLLVCAMALASAACDERRARFEGPTVKLDAGGGDAPVTDGPQDTGPSLDIDPIKLDVMGEDRAPCPGMITSCVVAGG